MKFNCNRLGDYLKARKRAQRDWHDHFCIIPRKLTHGDCRWLETVERRREFNIYWSPGFYSWWTYRAKVTS